MNTEFEFINNIKSKYGLTAVGDDCAVLPKDDKTDLVVTADMLVEEIDFRLDWTDPAMLGHKALAVSLSDIAAMGAAPSWAMISLGIPENLWKGGYADAFYEGWHALAAEFGVQLVGGDISRTPDKLVIDSIVAGEVAKGRAILRSGAKPGDGIYVTGELGGAATGLLLLQRNASRTMKPVDKVSSVLFKQLKPRPQLEAAAYIQENALATAMIDLSDGLSSDLTHVITASGVGARLDMDKIPRDNRVFIPATSFNEFERALHGGEDFELLFTVDEKKISPESLSNFYRIGHITANVGIIELIIGERSEILEPKGYRHF